MASISKRASNRVKVLLMGAALMFLVNSLRRRAGGRILAHPDGVFRLLIRMVLLPVCVQGLSRSLDDGGSWGRDTELLGDCLDFQGIKGFSWLRASGQAVELTDWGGGSGLWRMQLRDHACGFGCPRRIESNACEFEGLGARREAGQALCLPAGVAEGCSGRGALPCVVMRQREHAAASPRK